MKISLITPSFNSAPFMEACLRSVLEQNYPDLEYIVMDGGSTDGSVEIIRKYAGRLASWVSEPDQGHYDAVNKGFARASGEVMAFLNSDDMLEPGSLAIVAEIFEQFPEISWITGRPSVWDESGCRVASWSRAPAYGWKYLAAGEHDGRILPGVQQESCFWRRSLWDAVGRKIDTRWDLAGDFDLWTRMAQHAELVGVDTILSGNRRHPAQRSNLQKAEYSRQMDEIGAKLHCRAWLRSGWVQRLRRMRGGWRAYSWLFPQQGTVLVRGPGGQWVKEKRRVL